MAGDSQSWLASNKVTVLQHSFRIGHQYVCALADCITIDLLAAVVALVPVFWTIYNNDPEMWKSGDDEFTASKISRIKKHLKEGGEMWIRTDPQDARNSAVVKLGSDDHLRTHKSGCVLSIRATGEGDPDVISKLNTDNKIYLARDGIRHETLLTATAYLLVRAKTELEMAGSNTDLAPSPTLELVAGTTWLGDIIFDLLSFAWFCYAESTCNLSLFDGCWPCNWSWCHDSCFCDPSG